MNPEIITILFGLFAAASWGAGDFCGGLASKKSPVFLVILISQFVGFLFLLAFALIIKSPISAANTIFVGGLAGLCGAFGLVALYKGLASEPMGIVAPVAAVTTSILPVTVSIFTEGLPHKLQLLGFVFAILGVWLLSSGNSHSQLRVRALKLAFFAGIGFGLFFILIDRVSSESILWPLVAARVASVIMFMVIVKSGQPIKRPQKKQLILMSLAGILDSGGNVFYALATRVGRLDIAAVLSSLYPAVTVLLAWLILKEKLGGQQWIGIGSIVIALILISL